VGNGISFFFSDKLYSSLVQNSILTFGINVYFPMVGRVHVIIR